MRSRGEVGTIRHDHSIAKALNRGDDFEEGEQEDFLEENRSLDCTTSKFVILKYENVDADFL